ncbi:hypothetical protein SRHO_G00175740 [Serrasalmus rhombeus]
MRVAPTRSRRPSAQRNISGFWSVTPAERSGAERLESEGRCWVDGVQTEPAADERGRRVCISWSYTTHRLPFQLSFVSCIYIMEDRAESSSFTSPPEVFSHRFTITAQNAGIVTVPQVTGCHIGGSLNINVVHSAANVKQTQQASAKASNSACSISERVTEALKSNLKRKFETIFEGIAKRGNPTLLNKIYTELYITEGEREGLNKEHEVWQIDTVFRKPPEQDVPISCNDIFKPLEQTEEEKAKGITPAQPRVVLTKGIAGIGKTVSVQKFVLDWAEGKANQDIDLLLVLPFRELNSIKDEKQSLYELLLDFHSEFKELKDTKYYDDCKILFIFDGLDESQLPLGFGWKRVSNVSKAASLDELMTNLIDGNLLPSALVWITSRPAAIDKIPPDLIHRMTEIRGFTDLQKEEYFRKRISDQNVANRIISHVMDSGTLEIMCHIPVFCWITATVLEPMLKGGHEKIPSSLTELYTRFLLIQTSEKKKKYLGIRESDPRKLSNEDVQLVLKLGKLAFDNLQKSNIVFSEDDLKQYDIDVTEASLRSGLFTEIVKEEDPMFPVKKYSFVHLSFQEYLAAFFVVHTYADRGVNAMQFNEQKRATIFYDDDYYDDNTFYQDFGESDGFGHPQKAPQQKVTLYDLHKCAIDKALKSKSGHLDLFLRFLLGLLLESSQKLLNSFSVCLESGQNIHETIQYLKSKLREEDDRKTPSSERCINLLHCLLELNDHSMAEEIQRFLNSGTQAEQKLTAGQCSALAYIILMSGEVLEELDLKKYNTSEEGRRRLIPAVRNCRKAVMAGCRLTGRCFETVASTLQNPNAHLRELDLGQNNLGDRDLASLYAGLNSPHCTLESLDLSHINLRGRGADLLRAVLLGPHVQPHTLKVSACSLKDDCAEILRSAFWSSECRLRELDIGYNKLTPDGVKLVLQGLLSPNCVIQILRLSAVRFTANCCTDLASVLRHSFLRELILDQSDIGDVGAKRLCSGLLSPHCQLQILGLRDCKLSKKTCFYLTVALSTYSVLRELNLGDNDLQDPGVKLLSTGLKHPNCILQNLGLSGCMITKVGCSSLASALKSNPSHLRWLDLSYNHPGESGEKLLSARLKDPCGKLNMLRLDHGDRSRITPGHWKYYQELHMGYTQSDLTCSPEGKGVIRLPVFSEFLCYDSDDEEKKEPEKWATVQSREQLTGGRFYWELEWTGMVSVGVSDKVFLGKRLKLLVHQFEFQYPYYAMHNAEDYSTFVHEVTMNTPITQRIGLLLDWSAGTLSFYSISPEGESHLYTFHTKFTKPMYATFELTLPDGGHGIPSVAIATQSPDSVRHVKAQLFEHFGNFMTHYHGLSGGSNTPTSVQTAIKPKMKKRLNMKRRRREECSLDENEKRWWD